MLWWHNVHIYVFCQLFINICYFYSVHDCRPDLVKEWTDPFDWEAQLLVFGLKEVYKNAEKLHMQPREESTQNRYL